MRNVEFASSLCSSKLLEAPGRWLLDLALGYEAPGRWLLDLALGCEAPGRWLLDLALGCEAPFDPSHWLL